MTWSRRALAGGLALLASCALTVTAQAQSERENRQRSYANPSALIAAEIGFAQLAQEKGQWTAFHETAAEDAVMFVPQPVNARQWTKKRANPPTAVRWQPHAVWMSCDGSTGVTTGAWQGARGATGQFTTVWQRQKKGGYKWVLDQGIPLDAPLAGPDMLTARVASCTGPVPIAQAIAPADRRSGSSPDRTLSWNVDVDAQCGRTWRFAVWDGSAMSEVAAGSVAPPPEAQRPASGCS